MLTRTDRRIAREFQRRLADAKPLIDLQYRIENLNETTRQALEDALNRRNLESFESAEALFADLGI